MSTTISTADARKHFADLVNQVAYGKETVVLTRRGQEIVALVSMDEFKLLQQIEDHIDIEDAKKALADPGDNIPAQDVWKLLGLQHMPYSVEFRPAVLKSLKQFPKRDLVRIKKRIDDLSSNLPDPNMTKMKGKNAFHKIRSGDYRIVYEIHDDRLVILIVRIGHRKDVYKNLP